jgi:hypothetical protein
MLDVGAKVFHDDIGVPCKPVEDLTAGGRLQVDCNRPLIAMKVFAVEAREAGIYPSIVRSNHLRYLSTMIS